VSQNRPFWWNPSPGQKSSSSSQPILITSRLWGRVWGLDEIGRWSVGGGGVRDKKGRCQAHPLAKSPGAWRVQPF